MNQSKNQRRHCAQDLIALLFVITWCAAIFLPEQLVNHDTMQQFERILLMVVGFYFGSKSTEIKTLQGSTS